MDLLRWTVYKLRTQLIVSLYVKDRPRWNELKIIYYRKKNLFKIRNTAKMKSWNLNISTNLMVLKYLKI